MTKWLITTLLLLPILLYSQSVNFTTSNRLIFGTHQERTASAGLGDLDQDGDIDVVLANGRHWPGQNRIFINNGSGKFSLSKPLGDERTTSYSTELADFDGDGDLDIAVGNDMAPNSIFINDGNGHFTKSGSFGKEYAPTRNIVVTDIDKDGDIDILITNRGQQNEICLNDGKGNFNESIGFGTRDDSTIDVEVADMDKDGDLDLVLSNRDGQPNYIYLNNGRLNFSSQVAYGSGKDNTRSVAVSDFDNDGFVDIATANVGEPNAIYFGDEALSFERKVIFDQDSSQSSSISVADFNLDGLADLVVGNFMEPNFVYINKDHAKRWEAIPLSDRESFTYDILTADLNKDGKPDIVESNSDEVNRYYFNTYIESALKNIDIKGNYLIYRRQSLIGEESFQVRTTKDSIILETLQGENERGRITGVQSVLYMDKEDLTPHLYSSIRRSGGSTSNILKMSTVNDSLLIWEKHFDVERFKKPAQLFPLHSNLSAGTEMLLYHYYFRNYTVGQSMKTFPRGELTIVHRGQDLVKVRGKEQVLDRYVVEGINWGGRTIWLDEHKNLIAIVKANTQIREVIREEYAASLPVFVAGNVEEQMAALEEYTHKLKANQPQHLVLKGAELIDGITNTTQKRKVVVIRDGRIIEIGNEGEVVIPDAARVLDLEGKTIMPGLWDMHAHSNQVQWAPAYLAGGITTIRDNGNEVELATAFRDAIAKKGMLGPDILLAGMTDGPGNKGNGIIRATTPEEAREVVKMYSDLGYRQIKIYNSVEPEILRVLAEEAHARGLTVTGHVPDLVGTIHQSVELGMNMFSHDRAIASVLYPEKSKSEIGDLMKDDQELEPFRVKQAIDFLLENDIALDPTMNLRLVLAMPMGSKIEEIEPDAYRIAYELWEGKRFRKGISADESEKQVHRYRKILKAISDFYRAGVPIVAGTDNFIPVFGLYLELESYQKYAKLTPFEVIQTATIIPARVMGMESQTGSIEVGKEADIIILDKNPLEDIKHVRTVTATITNGNYYKSDDLWKAADFLPRKNGYDD
ncbi:FG-GAP-like repeat-containing protein [Portibacter marinus]|uniref:FG-GAP-like repeat-containing protein n=1 Tax=Portibacter marinus TaxID=2898660 RepID=UPI001F32913F|nr:FG-GAP-like repeat-containing protein [Portibacter marinus]